MRARRSAPLPSAKPFARRGRLTLRLALCRKMEQRSPTRLHRLRLMLLLRFSSAYSFLESFALPAVAAWAASAALRAMSVVPVVLCHGPGRWYWRRGARARSSTQKFTVSGTVVNEATGEPIPRAMVTLMGSPMRYAFSDSNGSFTIEGVPAGRYSMQAQKPGFFGPQERGGSRSVQSSRGRRQQRSRSRH